MGRPVKREKFVKCIHCGSFKTSKAGFTHNRKQRYYCRNCRRFSRENPVHRNPSSKRLSITSGLQSKGHLALELQVLAQELGRAPTTQDVNEFSKMGRCSSLITFYTLFGDFNSALKSARLKTRYNQVFDKKLLLDELKALHKKVGRPLIRKDVEKAYKRKQASSLYHFQKAFGSVPKAIEAAGAARQKPAREELITALRKLNKELGRAPRGKDIMRAYSETGFPSLKSFIREFGSLEKARRKAGIIIREGKPPGYWQKYSREELLEQLKHLEKELGRKPTDRDINAASKKGEMASSETFTREFGNLIEAYKAAGFELKKPREYTKAEIIGKLQDLTRKLGRLPLYVDIKAASEAGECPAPGTIYRRIGSIEVARRKAKLSSLV